MQNVLYSFVVLMPVTLLVYCPQNPVRGACWFELQFSAAGGGGVSVLSAESEQDMQDWTDKLNRVLVADKGPTVRDKGKQ